MKFWSECTEKLEAKLSQEEFNTARNEYQLSEAKAKGGIFFDDIDQQEEEIDYSKELDKARGR